MEDREKDYKKLYEETLLTLSEKEELLLCKEQELTRKEEIISDLKFELDKFLRQLFGAKSEKRDSQAGENQLGLFELGTTRAQQEELSQAAAVIAKPTPKKRAKGTGRMPLPEELPREEIVIEPSESIQDCVKIGEEVTEVLEIIPASFYVKRYIRPKYARPNGEGILIGTLPDRVIEKGIPSESVVAHMTVEKYVYGKPLHRQLDQFTRLGVRVPASTASDWIMAGWEQLIPLWELHRMIVLNQKYLQVDESPIKVLDRDHQNGIHQGYMWLYHAPVDRLVLFDYRRGRDQSGPKAMLADFKGIIQTDGYKVYHALFENHPHIHLTFCMAHARRYFVHAVKDDEKQANYVLDEIQKLYLLEEKLRAEKSTWEQRTQARKTYAEPILEKLEKWLEQNRYSYRPVSPMGKAIGYAYTRWAGLSAYTLHGQMEIDNNLVENAVRPLAIGRKNYLFAGSHNAAEMTAAMYSFMASCKRNHINEFEWLKDVFERIQSINHKNLYQLLPSNWEEYRPK
ncbi:MAG: IS66 family transposase [Algoriphagus aquaeductus]|uniref:IS66 family transposase n=1 Tax=Algoriphagus aquaeductus TaxID=475299 RepID=UPI0038795515